MMAITEETVVAGIMTFFLYGVLPTMIILYVGGSGRRRQRREQQLLQAMQERQQATNENQGKDPPAESRGNGVS